VVGADGMHSITRRLTFGPEDQFLEHLGFYLALTDLPSHAQPDRRNPMYNFPGHMIGIATYRDKALGTFMFRSSWIDYNYHDLDAQKQILRDAFAGHTEWKVPDLLDAASRDDELYFDSVSQICMSSWHRGWYWSGFWVLRIPAVRSRHKSGHDRRLAARRSIRRSPW
jgi:2-polyprenyl-6-methoxyphenol hydroxylase-like FAD-dependent oxidoreductase